MRDVYSSAARARRSPVWCSLSLALLSSFSVETAAADSFVYPAPESPVYDRFVLSAGGTLEVEVGTQITGDIHSNGSVDLRSGSTVTGNVSAAGQIVGGGTVTGTKTAGAASLPLPAPFDEATARGLADRVFEGNATFDTDQVINDVLFVDGDARFRGSVNGTGTIISTGSIIFDNVTLGHPVVLDPSTRLSFSAGLDISIGKIHPMRGVLVAGRDLVADKELDITGVVVAGRNVRVHQDSKLVKLVLDRFPPAVAITAPADGAYLNTPIVRVTGTVADDGVLAAVTVNGTEVPFPDGSFAADVTLAEGANEIIAAALDSTGKHAAASVGVVLDTVAPTVTVETPAPGQLTNQSEVRVAGSAADDRGIAELRINGQPAPLADGRFETSVALAEGPSTISVRAVDVAGNAREANVAVTRFTLPVVTITSPADLSYLAATTVDVSGVVSGPVTAVEVNGVSAEVAGTSFIARDVPLIEGGNILAAAALDANGHIGTASIHVVRDLTPPLVAIYRPASGLVSREGTVAVSGLVNDIVPGTVNAAEAAVTVNGVAAEVVNRSFFVDGVALAPGENVLVARAVDASGNAGEDRVTVTFAAAVGSRVRVVSGNHQTGEIGTALAQPLVVELLDSAGQPVAGKSVIFKVRENDGRLDGGGRQIAVTSDAAGRAQATFTLGTRAGVANQVVEADAVGFEGPAVFTASALPAEGALIVVDSGGFQVGVVGQQVPRPLIAAVVDSGHNRLQGVPVAFRVVEGAGHFAGGVQETVVDTDSDGRAIVTFTLDPEEGRANNVEARIQGLEDGPVASFVASGRSAGDPAATTISGVVLDNTNVPIAGATLRVKHTALTAVSDQQGQFRIAGAPVGAVQLIVDGSTVSRPGAWPDLEFELVTIAGRDNTINMPIYLLPLDLGASLPVDETRGGVLTLPEVPGFALEVAPGSVTFPGGGRSGLVSVTVVHSDKVPMVPNFGQQPRLIVTIQPAGARFDPPARLTLPNVDGLPRGKVTEMYSFDHDLGHFVSIGPATVSEDGTVIVSNPGVGIVKAGWHCGGDPATGVCLHNCPECRKCIDPPCRCDPDDTKTPTSITNTPGDCKKPGCRSGSATQVPDPADRPQASASRHNYCKKCDNNGNIVPDTARDYQRVPGTDCANCKDGTAVDDNYNRTSTGGRAPGRACDYCTGKVCVDGKCEQKGDTACSSPGSCPSNMCGTPCSCMGGTGGMSTTEFACWAVKEPNPAGGFIFVCYRDYGVLDLPDQLEDVCCGGGCGRPVTGQPWTVGTPPYRCTAAEVCTLAQAQKCPGKVGF